MASCHDMRNGQVYTCRECGIELQVIKECRDVGKPAEECGCHDDGETCGFTCCGEPLVLKG